MIPFLDIHTRAILSGEFFYYDKVKSQIVEMHPELEDYQPVLSGRLDLERHVKNDLLPAMKTDCSVGNCKLWLTAMRTRIIGPL